MASPDFNEVVRGIQATMPDASSIFEVRLIQAYTGYINTGYFDNAVDAANVICLTDNESIAGAYMTINPVIRDCFARVSNRLISGRNGHCTSDPDILYRHSVLLDYDPKRKSGISSTEEEHARAIQHARDTEAFLTAIYGFPIPMLVDSGNGAHSRYYVEDMPVSKETDELFKNFVHCCHAVFSTDLIDVDRTIFNPAQIIRIPGTPARKGENRPDRPHRLSRIIREHGPGIVTRDQMQLFINTMRSHMDPQRKANGQANGINGVQTADPFARARAEYPEDEKLYKNLNAKAKNRVHDWVPHLLAGMVRKSGNGYRLSNKQLPTGYEEDFLIDDKSIKDFGSHDMGDKTEGRRTAVTMVADLLTQGDKAAASERLALILDCPANDFGFNILLDPPKPGPGMPSNLLGDIQVDFSDIVNMHSDTSMGYGKSSVWMVDNLILAESLNVVNAGPKMGKSTFIRQLVAACMLGEPFLQILAPCVEILYIAYEDLIEDLYADIRLHMSRMLGHLPEDVKRQRMAEAERRLHIYGAKRATGGRFSKIPRGKVGQDIIKEQLRKNPGIKIVVADPMRFLFNDEFRSRNLVNQEWYEMLDLSEMAVQCKVSFIGVHHSNKNSMRAASADDDPMGALGGTSALGAAAQNVIIFRGDRVPAGVNAGTELYVSGRKSGANSIVVQFHEGQFFKAPAGTEVYWRKSVRTTKTADLPQRIIAALTAEIALTAQELIDRVTGTDKASMSRVLREMREEGTIVDEEDILQLGSRRGGPKPKIWRLTGKHRLIQY